jgi:hypothetical protein
MLRFLNSPREWSESSAWPFARQESPAYVMDPQDTKEPSRDQTRRTFLQAVGAGVPTLTILLRGTTSESDGPSESSSEKAGQKFTPVDLQSYFNTSSVDFGPREKAKGLTGESGNDGLIRMPGGNQTFRGIPFRLGRQGIHDKSWLVLSTSPGSKATPNVEIPLAHRANFICLAAFCDWDGNETPPPRDNVIERLGQLLADVILVYEDGLEEVIPIRRRFEVNSPSIFWGHLCFAALPHRLDYARRIIDPLADGLGWGPLQTNVQEAAYEFGPEGKWTTNLWVSALANPAPERNLKALRLRAASEDPVIVCGITLYRGRQNPLRHERLSLYRLTLPEAAEVEDGRWKVEVDLGIVARTYWLGDFEPEAWLSARDAGLGEKAKRSKNRRYLYTEVAASPEATLQLRDTKSGTQHGFDLGQVVPGKELEAKPVGSKIEILEREKVWIHGQVVDASTGRPTPVRLAFRSRDGRYIPPYGHRTEINDGWFQDYGADIKLMDTSFAYIDGSFQVDLPVGEVYVEMTKGFEYDVVRQKLKIDSAQRELKLEISRFTDHRSKGWVTADPHVHFISSATAVLEGQAEGLNLVNILAAHLGDLFTSIGDLAHGPITSRDGETIVRVGTENRQHILGHLGLLGGNGEPVFPMSASGPQESYLGDPLWSSMAEWADACREREGLVVAVHFPYPTGEIAADIVLGKIDAVELFPYSEDFNTLCFYDWYHYLNCGYRLPGVGGTDKMGAYMPVGANRTYAYLGHQEFTFENWAKAVRSGNTFMTSGPLLSFQADGQVPGEEITLGPGGGTVEVLAEAKCFVPIHHLEIVQNGRVVARREEHGGVREITLKESIHADGPGWLAARCGSRLGPTTSWNFKVMAHTSPVYVRVPGQEIFSAPAAAYLLTLMEGSQAWVEHLATRPDAEQYEKVRKVFLDARERLHRRMHEHGIKH